MKEFLKRALPTALLVAGAAAVSAGIGMIFPPAGVIGAGAFAIAGGVLMIIGGGEERG